MPPEPGSPQARRRKLFSLADHIGLSRDQRIEFARAMLWRDIKSWQSLDDAQVDRLLDALEGWVLIEHIRTQEGRPSGDGSTLAPQPRQS